MRNLWLPLLVAAHVLVGWWPPRAGYWLADAVGTLVAWLSPGTRRAAHDNQSRALGPGARPAQLRRSVGGVFRHTARNYFDLVNLGYLGSEALERRLRVHGRENLERALAQARGVVVATAHLGSPELAVQGLARYGAAVTVLTEPLEPPALFRAVTRWRQSHGLECVPTGVAGLKQALRRLRAGGLVVVTCDRDLRGAGERLPFLGEPALCPTGAASLALKTGAVLLPAFCARSQGTALDIFIEPPLEAPAEGPLEERARAATAQLLRVAEGYIRRYPDQWYVFDQLWSGGAATPGELAAGTAATRS